MAYMSDSPEHPTETTGPVSAQTVTAAPPPPPPPPVYVVPQQPEKQNRVNQVAAWVGIVAGSVFVVAVIFGTGFMVGKHSGSGFDRHEAVMFKQRAEPPFPMGPRSDFERGPFIFRGPDFQPPQLPQPPREPETTAPARP
jgi:hypothetical protein